MIKEQDKYPQLKVLDETDVYLVGYQYEDAYIIEKKNFREVVVEDFYGDPSCALISRNNDWIIIAGERLVIWKDNRLYEPAQEGFQWIHALRTHDQKTVEILTDPWTEHSAIWTLNTDTLALGKVRDFYDYRDKPWTEDVVW